MCDKHQLVVVVVDDAHHMDAESWALLEELSADPRAVVVLTLKPVTADTALTPAVKAVLTNLTTRIVPLRGLQPEFIPPLACQLLKVQEIPLRLNE